MRTTISKITFIVLLVSSLFAAAACKAKTDGTEAAGPAAPAMTEKEFESIELVGAGASFPYPVYSQWASQFNQLTGLKLNYQSIGSGGGIAQIKARTVDFGASDAPLTKEELDAAGLIQFPMVMGGVVPVVHIEGVGEGRLKLTPDLLADIFLGKVAKWNDKAVRDINPDLKLPEKDISVVHRADGSGTTWIFTSYLSKVSAEWKQKLGNDKAVAWPVGLGGKGNEGVAAYVQKLGGSIGYIEFAYAIQSKIPYALLRNSAGEFVAPTIEAFQSAASNADWKNAPGFAMVLTDQPGKESWPITGASFILVYKAQADATKADAMLKFFDWCYRHGQETARQLHYVPMPESVVDLVETSWSGDLSAAGQKVWRQ
jgi:phosphate transport system substrate-binding protein